MRKSGKDFFRQATLRLCSSLDIEKALFNCFSYLRNELPVFQMLLTLFDPRLGLIHNIARVDIQGIQKPFSPKSLSEEALRKVNMDVAAWQDIKILDRLDLHPAASILSQLAKLSTTSIMYMNLVIEGILLGSVIFLAEGKGRYDRSHSCLVGQLREPFNIAVSNALRYREVVKLKDIVDAENQALARELRHSSKDEIIGADNGLKEVMEMVRQVASLKNPVLLLGETGVGKEIIANAIHYASPRKGGPTSR